MRGAQGLACGPVGDNLVVVDDLPEPEYDPKDPKMGTFALVRVLGASVAPGDVRVLSGKVRELQGPKTLPYVPGGDVCGVVERVHETEKRLKVGQTVVFRFYEDPLGGMSERAIVHTGMCAPKPETIDGVTAAALGSSGLAAMGLQKYVRKGDRVLVLGGGGGVGTTFVQLAKLAGASFVAVTSTQEELMLSLGVDRVIDYTKDDVWTMPEFCTPEGRFSLIVDMASGGWRRARKSKIIKSAWSGGRFVTITLDEPWFELHSWMAAIRVLVFPALRRATWSRIDRRLPRYSFTLAHSHDPKPLEELFALIDAGKVRPVVDPRGPFPFTTEGVREAFKLQESRHGHGKIVIQVAPVDEDAKASEKASEGPAC